MGDGARREVETRDRRRAQAQQRQRVGAEMALQVRHRRARRAGRGRRGRGARSRSGASGRRAGRRRRSRRGRCGSAPDPPSRRGCRRASAPSSWPPAAPGSPPVRPESQPNGGCDSGSHPPFSAARDGAARAYLAQAAGHASCAWACAGHGHSASGRTDGSPLTTMRAQNNNRRRLPRRRRRRQREPAATAGADDLRRFIGSVSMPVPVDLAVGRRIALSFVASGSGQRALAGAAAGRAALARSRRLQPVGRCARRPAAGAAGERRAGRAAHGGRQRGVQRPARGDRLRRAAAARLGHDRAASTSPTAPLVQKGQLLFTIDPRPFEAEAARAQSQLAAAKARAELAQSELARAKTLLDSQAISRQEFDQLHARARAPRRPTSRAPRRRCASPGSTSSTPRSARRSPGAPRAPTSPSATWSTSSRC